ncbi:hypothetical protein L1887_29331 [Cichorium endivia]|nr:hypothetical protein L1887_29331 [Cichorium endivia]
MGRAPCCSKVGLHRGAWSSEEDKLLTEYIQTHGEGQWRSMPSKAGLLRCGKSFLIIISTGKVSIDLDKRNSTPNAMRL